MNDLRRPWWKVLATILAFTLIAVACGDDSGGETSSETTVPPRGFIDGGGGEQPDPGEGPQYGGRIVVALEAETQNWLPGMGNFVVPSGTSVAHTIYDPLIILSGEGEYSPYLAESLEPNNDLTEWTLKLRRGIKFHDGSDLDAEVLVWNFDTLHNVVGSNTFGAITANGIESIEAIDDLTVRYQLNQPNAAFPDSLRGSLGWPVSREAYEELGEDLGESPVGTGPFRFKQWTRDDRLIVERNPNYWRTDDDGNKLPYLDEIEFRPIPNEDSRYQSLASDAVQVMVTLRGYTAKQVLGLVEDRDYHANVFVGNQSGVSLFNQYRAPVDDIRVRSALILMSDGHDIAKILGDDGLVPRTDGFFSPESPWYSEEAGKAYLARDGIDQERAQQFLDDYINDPNRSDGKNPGEPVAVEYTCQSDPTLIEIGQYYQQMWGLLGVDVTLRQLEQVELVGAAMGDANQDPPFAGNYMITCFRATGGEGDPLTNLQSWFEDPDTNQLNFTNFSHPEIDKALDTLRTSPDFETRYEAVETINRINNENATMTWSIATPTLVGWRSDIQGLTTWVLPDGSPGNETPGGHMHFSQVWLRP